MADTVPAIRIVDLLLGSSSKLGSALTLCQSVGFVHQPAS